MKKQYTPPTAEFADLGEGAPTENFGEGERPVEIYDEFSRPRLPFWQKLVIYGTTWLLVIFLACCIMWNIMQQYEEAQPWYAVEEYISSSGQTAFYIALTMVYDESFNEYENLYDIAHDLAKEYTGNISYKKLIREYTYESPVYLLYSGDKNLLKLTLSRDGYTGFAGMRGYSVHNVELASSDILDFKNYALVFPDGATVKINGKTYEPVETAEFSVFGTDAFTVCTLENFHKRPTVKVTLDGEELTAEDGGNFIFDYPEKKMRTVTVTAPKGATVRIDGEKISEIFISGEEESEPDRFGATQSLVKYILPTVCGEGKVSATLGQTPVVVTSVGDAASVKAVQSCTVIVPSGAVLIANGAEVDPALRTSDGAVWLADFEGINDFPTADEYTFTDIYAVPDFTAKLGENELSSLTDDKGRTVFINAPSEELKEAHTEKVLDFMNAYLYYTTQGFSNTRENLDAVKAKVASPSPLYTNLERSYIGYYYIAPQKMTVEQMTADDFVPYGENAFTCKVSYKVDLRNWVGSAVEESTVSLAFVKRGNTFLPVNMKLLD